jgi:hypothetical protein
MINDFLFRLINDASADFGDIPKPAAAVTAYTAQRRAVQDALLIGVNKADRFKSAVALTLMLRHSMIAAYERHADTRITYDDDDLIAELLGGDDTVTVPNGVTATYAAGANAPSEETWKATRRPDGGGLVVMSSMGTESVNVAFNAVSAVSVPLRIGDITLSVVGVPAVGSSIVVSRNSKYKYSVGAATARVAALGDGAVLSLLPRDLVGLYSNGFVMRSTTRLVAAAVGVAYAR